MIDFWALSPRLGAEVLGVDLRNELDESARDALRRAWHLHGLLLFRGGELSESDVDRAASIFGEISLEGDYPPYVSNIIPDALVPQGELRFHMDFSFADDPLRGIMLYAHEVPPEGAGGDTLFANVQLAYEGLPLALRAKVDNLQIVHATQSTAPNHPRRCSTHPAAFPHPVTGETVLYCSPHHFREFVGLGAEEGRALCAELAEQISRPEIVYRHVWRQHDLVVWDNIKLQHARTDFDPKHRRHLRRTQIAAPASVSASSG